MADKTYHEFNRAPPVEFIPMKAIDNGDDTYSSKVEFDRGEVDPNNSTVTPLAADATFTGEATEILDFGFIFVNTISNVPSATDGLMVEQSSDGTNWDGSDEYSVPANKGKTYSFQAGYKYYRVVYKNGDAEQTFFRLQSILKSVAAKPSSHRIQDPITDDDDAELQKSVITGESELTEAFENISTYRKALNVNSAWVHRKIVNETFHQDTGDSTTLAVAASEGDTSITVVSAAGFAIGSEITLTENGTTEIGLMTLTNVVGNVLTLDRPLGGDYTTAADVDEVISNMAVAGTLASPQSFQIHAPTGTIWQMTRIMFTMVHVAAADDSKFGGIAALTNGVSLRATTSAGRTVTFANWKINRDMKLDMYDVTYSDKAGGGNNGTNGRWTFTKSEVVAELNGDASPLQKLEVLVQDNLTTLVSFTMRGQGRVFSP
jgi:hypothetical protein